MLPGSNATVNDTNPSATGHTKGKTTPQITKPLPLRSRRLLPIRSDCSVKKADRFLARWADTSTRWPLPDRWASARAISVPPAASAPAWAKAVMAAVRSGGRSIGPARSTLPEAACTMRSVAA